MSARVARLDSERRLGTWLRDKYRLDWILGEGGMAVVYAATHRNKKRFAVKLLHTALASHAEVHARFLREGYVANTVDHPGAVAVLDDDLTEDGSAFLVMELLDGSTVKDLGEQHEGKLGAPVVLALAHQLLDVLAAAHARNIVHRDIKPGNLFVTRAGLVKVLDFGIARLREAEVRTSATQTGVHMGTPAFMSPEQAMGRTSLVDARSDLWSVGATLFSLLTGRDVHLGESAQHKVMLAATIPAPPLASVLPGVPESVAKIVDRALALDKTERWETAAAMREVVGVAYEELTGEPVTARLLVEALPEPGPEPERARSLPAPALVTNPAVDPTVPSPPEMNTGVRGLPRRADTQPDTDYQPGGPVVSATMDPVSSSPPRIARKSRRRIVAGLAGAALFAAASAGVVALRSRTAPTPEAGSPAAVPDPKAARATDPRGTPLSVDVESLPRVVTTTSDSADASVASPAASAVRDSPSQRERPHPRPAATPLPAPPEGTEPSPKDFDRQ